jgi:hypothetical protein
MMLSNRGLDSDPRDAGAQGNRWVAGFHLGDARLARLKFCGKIHL